MQLTLDQYEKLSPRCQVVHEGTAMIFMTPSTFTHSRVTTIYTKEPCTLEWISSFSPDDILLDVGANVGMYSIWAAATRKCRVFSFEPESQNFHLLNRNIEVNNLQDRIKAYCIGLSDQQGFFDLNMADMRVGGSNHALGEPLDFKNEPFKQVHFKQGAVAFTLDQLIASQWIPVPNHIKIDVDGIEHKIIAGAANLIQNPTLRSFLIETNLNLESHRGMVQHLLDAGFKVDQEQVKSATRQAGTFKGVAEHVFRR